MPTSRLRAAAGNTEDRTGGATLTALRAITEDVPDLPTAIRTAGFVVRISRAAVAPIKTVKRVITANWAAKSNTSAVTKTLSSVATMMVTGEATGATGVIIEAVLVLLLIKLLHVARRKRFFHSCEFFSEQFEDELGFESRGVLILHGGFEPTLSHLVLLSKFWRPLYLQHKDDTFSCVFHLCRSTHERPTHLLCACFCILSTFHLNLCRRNLVRTDLAARQESSDLCSIANFINELTPCSPSFSQMCAR